MRESIGSPFVVTQATCTIPAVCAQCSVAAQSMLGPLPFCHKQIPKSL